MPRCLLILVGIFVAVFADTACNPALQVCDMEEIEEEMAAASKRGYAFIQAKSERQRAKARGAIKDSLATHNAIVQEQVERLAAKHGPGKVLHKRTMVQFSTEGDAEL
uniref:Uncharacterized protein n=1 Tax=Alexandrium andersonii TaxID=327968 RepID=A0A7S2I559_9DINO|mmetsp:Transcript_78738/g.176076  ORF Transcript_78738/g.176076 Transcript_78738/m.176076 type:complete len:108 (+) Transcript_78738:114-437(+)